MKSLNWSEAEIGERFSSQGSLANIIGHIEDECAEKGEVVCEVSVNGVVFDENDEVRFAAVRINEIKSLSVKISGFGDLLDESVETLWDYLPEMIRVSLLAVEKYRTDDIEGGTKTLGAIVQGSTWLVDMLANLRNNKVVELKNLSREDWTQAEEDLLRITTQITVALEAKDYVLLSDVLEYDWVTVLQDWLVLLGCGDTIDGHDGTTASNSLDR